nr:reverse transcriptase domain-containing protein [Tanacetum cinerariifolium]
MDDEPMWAADRVVASTPSFAITIRETANKFSIKGNQLTLVKENQFDGRTKTDPHKHIHEFLIICDMFKYRDTENEDVRLMMFPLSLTGEAKTWLEELNEGTIETEITQEVLNAVAGVKKLQSRAKQPTPDLNDDDMPMSREEEAKFMKTFLAKNHQAYIQNLESKFDRLDDKQSGRPFGSLPSNTQPSPRGSNSKAYQPPQARNKHVNAVFTRSVKSYNPPDKPNDQHNNFENAINFDSEDEDDEPALQSKTQPTKSIKEKPLPKPYKPKIQYPQRLRKEKMDAQYRKFLGMIRAVRINVPLVGVLAGMTNYGEFLKELISNKHKIEQISAAILSNESSAMIQNKVLPKLGDPESFVIPCNCNNTLFCNALDDLGASINLVAYSLYAKLSLETLKHTKRSVRNS